MPDFKWLKGELRLPDGMAVPAYTLYTATNKSDANTYWRWSFWRAPSGIVQVTLNGKLFGVDKKSDLGKVQARVDRIASSLGHVQVQP